MDVVQSASREFLRDPRTIVDQEPAVMDTLAAPAFGDLRLAAVDGIPTVRRAAERRGITEVDHVDDLLPLLFTQDTFKAYPQSCSSRATSRSSPGGCRPSARSRWTGTTRPAPS